MTEQLQSLCLRSIDDVTNLLIQPPVNESMAEKLQLRVSVFDFRKIQRHICYIQTLPRNEIVPIDGETKCLVKASFLVHVDVTFEPSNRFHPRSD